MLRLFWSSQKLGCIFTVFTCFFPCSCGVSEADFIAGAEFDACDMNTPVCQRSAGCIMGEYKYIKAGVSGGNIGLRSFVVDTPEETTIVVKIFFKKMQHPGEETTIEWFEVGCHDSYKYSTDGKDIFVLAGGDRTFEQARKVRQAGPHLIEIDSDAVAEVFIRVELITPMD